jgi:hypothetical protein
MKLTLHVFKHLEFETLMYFKKNHKTVYDALLTADKQYHKMRQVHSILNIPKRYYI